MRILEDKNLAESVLDAGWLHILQSDGPLKKALITSTVEPIYFYRLKGLLIKRGREGGRG